MACDGVEGSASETAGMSEEMTMKKVAILGLGLMGGALALASVLLGAGCCSPVGGGLAHAQTAATPQYTVQIIRVEAEAEFLQHCWVSTASNYNQYVVPGNLSARLINTLPENPADGSIPTRELEAFCDKLRPSRNAKVSEFPEFRLRSGETKELGEKETMGFVCERDEKGQPVSAANRVSVPRIKVDVRAGEDGYTLGLNIDIEEVNSNRSRTVFQRIHSQEFLFFGQAVCLGEGVLRRGMEQGQRSLIRSWWFVKTTIPESLRSSKKRIP